MLDDKRDRDPITIQGTCVAMTPAAARREMTGTGPDGKEIPAPAFPPWCNAVVVVGSRGYPVVETPEEVEAAAVASMAAARKAST